MRGDYVLRDGNEPCSNKLSKDQTYNRKLNSGMEWMKSPF